VRKTSKARLHPKRMQAAFYIVQSPEQSSAGYLMSGARAVQGFWYGWIHNHYGLSELDAYELLSKVGRIHLNEVVDPNYVVVASVEKKYLPGEEEVGDEITPQVNERNRDFSPTTRGDGMLSLIPK
jgi:hypothetical protein